MRCFPTLADAAPPVCGPPPRVHFIGRVSWWRGWRERELNAATRVVDTVSVASELEGFRGDASTERCGCFVCYIVLSRPKGQLSD